MYLTMYDSHMGVQIIVMLNLDTSTLAQSFFSGLGRMFQHLSAFNLPGTKLH